MSKKKFWSLMVSFIVLAFVIPLCYLMVRFNLFRETTKVQVGVWGVICIVIIAIALKTLIAFYIESIKTKWSRLKQFLQGFSKLVLPLIISLAILYSLKDNIDGAIEALLIIIPCEITAIIINPIPKWAFENNVEGIGNITDKIFHREGGNK